MSFFGFLLSSLGTLAIDTVAALINGPPPTVAKVLKDKSFKSNAYGNPIPRCRGTVRNQGMYWWMSGIQTSWWKTVSGGIFGIGSKSVYVPYYSISALIGFGEKLGGGAAQKFTRIWLDGKLLYNILPALGSITGTVTASAPLGGQPNGQQYLDVDLAAGATLVLYPGDLIMIPGIPGVTFQVQQAVNLTGPLLSAPIPIWPGLTQTITGGGALTLVGANSPVWDLSSFDPNPHDGSHFDSGFFCTPGGVNFYYGSASDPADPILETYLGVGHVPGYTNRVKLFIHNLQLKNYGNHPPMPSAEVVYDTPGASFPLIGPVAGVSVHIDTTGFNIGMPYSAASAVNMQNPLQPLPYIWVLDAASGTIYKVDTQTNQLLATGTVPFLNTVPAPVDTDGYMYLSGAGAPIYKFDGMDMTSYLTSPFNMSDSAGVTPWDQEVSLFGNQYLLKLLAAFETFGGMYLLDRNTMLPFGVNGGGSLPVVTGYKQPIGGGTQLTPIEGVGVSISSLATRSTGFVSGLNCCVDVNGDFWVLQKNWLQHFNNQWVSGLSIDPTTGLPTETLLPPSWARTDYDMTSIVGGGGGQLFFNPTDNTLILVGGNIGKVDLNGNILANVSNPWGGSPNLTVDLLGTILVGGGTMNRFNVNTMQVGANYPQASWSTTFGNPVYEQVQDSMWVLHGSPPAANLYRVLLDRGNGSGIGLDSIVSSLMLDAGYTAGEFDVTQLTTSGITCGGVELDRESFLDSLKRLMQLYLFDAAEIDGQIVFVPRGNAPILTIPESDLGVTAEPNQYEPRMTENVLDELETPESVWVRYYDTLKSDQQAVQYSKRISAAYASSLANAKPNTHTKQRLDITSPVTDGASAIKTQTDKILWDIWAGRPQRKAKLPFGGSSTAAYWRLDPTDVVDIDFQGQTLETRLEEADLGASMAVEITGRNQDESVYTNTNIPAGSAGSSSGGAPIGGIQNPNGNSNYTLSPPYPLSSPNSTTIDIAAFTALFPNSGLRLSYAARTGGSAITVPNPGAGLSAIYYVTIQDVNFVGEPSGTPTLTVEFSTNPASAFVGVNGYIFLGAVTVLGAGATTTNPNPLPGGQPPPPSSVGPTLEVPFGPTDQYSVDGFKVAHSLGAVPSNVQIQITPGLVNSETPTGAVGEVWFQSLRYDAQYVYLVASSSSLVGYLEIWE